MKILLIGATGFLGRALVLRLRRDGHELTARVRDRARAQALLGREVSLLGPDQPLEKAIGGYDAVVNLAGEPVLPQRWSAARRRRLIASRVGVTDQIVQALAATPRRPRVFVAASAVGIYGDAGDEELRETSAHGRGFLADLCVRWEAAAAAAEPLGVRVVTLRTGVVLGLGGGMLESVLPLFRLGLGGRLGRGRQWLPWIHLHDVVELIATALVDERYRGPFNLTAPEPVTNDAFTRELASALGKRPGPPAPAFVLRALLGEAASALLGSQRALPEKALAFGFRFAYPTLRAALADLLPPGGVSIRPLATPSDTAGASAYLARRRPTHELSAASTLDASRSEVFSFFSRPENLGLMTPAELHFRILEAPGEMHEGTRIDYRIKLGVAPFRWRTHIERLEAPERFVDTQEQGPYRAWWHEHAFSADGARTVMHDRVLYAVPFGWLGKLVHGLVVAPALRRIFAYRESAIRLRFGGARLPHAAGAE